jgi:exopolysaccharide biosynthesis polyprenyl glycosylphosphotransferase
LILGVSAQTEMLIQEILDSSFLGLKIIGILDDKKMGEVGGFKILGDFSKLEYVIKKHFVDEVFIAGHLPAHSIEDIIAQCVKLDRSVRLLIEDFKSSLQKLSLNYLGSAPLVTYYEKNPASSKFLAKRIFDVIISGLLLIVLFPLLFIIAVCVRFESKGPIFYTSKRSGRKGIVFNFYKFRSMVYNADKLKEQIRHKSEVDGPIFKIKKDPRLTKIGAFLRKYSLDELPQLFNVLKGDMSLVGPRPFPVEESDRIEYKHIPRLGIRPGITGLAQVKGRSDLKFGQWMRWDTWYIKNWSLGLDIRILLWTIPTILKGRGAY